MKKIKKYLLIILFLSIFFHIDVLAEEIYVCDSTEEHECNYHSLDQAFSYIETLHYNTNDDNTVVVYLEKNDEQVISNHTFDIPVVVVSEYGLPVTEASARSINSIVINGEDSTLNTNYPIRFSAEEVYLQNWNIIYHDKRKSYPNEAILSGVVNINTAKAYFDQFHLTNSGKSYSCTSIQSNPLVGISFNNSDYLPGPLVRGSDNDYYLTRSFMLDFTFQNSSVSYFDIGIVNYPFGVDAIASYEKRQVQGRIQTNSIFSIQNADLYDNFLSFDLYSTYVMIANSKLTSLFSSNSVVKFLEGNSFGDSKVIRENVMYYGEEDYRVFILKVCSLSKDKKNAYIVSLDDNPTYTTSEIEIRLEKTENVSDQKIQIPVLERFINTKEVDTSLFQYTVSDENIAKMENGSVVLLKNEDVDVIATNPSTNETYILHLRMNRSVFQNPVTGTFLVLCVFLSLFLLSFLFLRITRKKILKKK